MTPTVAPRMSARGHLCRQKRRRRGRPGPPNGSTTQYIADRPGNATIDRGPAAEVSRHPEPLTNHCNRKARWSEKSRDEVACRHGFALIRSRVMQDRGRLVDPTPCLLL